MIRDAISCDMSQTFLGRGMNSEPKQKRERFQQLTQNPKVKTGKAFAADLRKSKIHPTVKKLTAWRKLSRLSQRKAVAVLAQYYFHATFASDRRASQKMSQLPSLGPDEVQLELLTPWYTQNTSESQTLELYDAIPKYPNRHTKA
jgi:hypothetical protein